MVIIIDVATERIRTRVFAYVQFYIHSIVITICQTQKLCFKRHTAYIPLCLFGAFIKKQCLICNPIFYSKCLGVFVLSLFLPLQFSHSMDISSLPLMSGTSLSPRFLENSFPHIAQRVFICKFSIHRSQLSIIVLPTS